MKRHLQKVRLLIALLIAAFFIPAGMQAQTSFATRSRGPIRIRSQFPLGLQFLSLPADHAFALPKESWRVAVHFEHANTFIRSNDIWGSALGSGARGTLSFVGAQRLAQTGAQPDDFLIDSGLGRLAVNLSYGVTDRLTLEAEVPILNFYGGFLDVPIERVHTIFNFDKTARTTFVLNGSQVFLAFGGQLYYRNAEDLASAGLGDIVLSARQQLTRAGKFRPAMAVRAAVKLPTGDARAFRGSGSFDYGVQFAATQPIGRHFLTLNLAATFPGKWQLMPDLKLVPAYSMILAYEHQVGNKLSFIVQNQILTSVLERAAHPGIAETTYEWTIGIKADLFQRYRGSFAITENYINHNSTSDFGFHVGIERGF